MTEVTDVVAETEEKDAAEEMGNIAAREGEAVVDKTRMKMKMVSLRRQDRDPSPEAVAREEEAEATVEAVMMEKTVAEVTEEIEEVVVAKDLTPLNQWKPSQALLLQQLRIRSDCSG